MNLSFRTFYPYRRVTGNDCFTYSATYGCGVLAPRATSFGPAFNAVGGGWYAMERSDTYIKIWHWQRNDTDIPLDVLFGSALIDTSNWVSLHPDVLV